MNRKLASIREIIDIKPIDGADKIEVATVDGWNVVVRKGEFKLHQLVMYFEVDSFLPQWPQFEFLAKSSSKCMDGVQGYRLKTIRLRGQISQGLILPITDFKIKNNIRIGEDFTERLGIKVYEVTRNNITTGTKPKGIKAVFYIIKNKVTKMFPKSEPMFEYLDKLIFKTAYVKKFPHYISKTDQERIQNLTSKIDTFRDVDFEVTIKLDGSSMTVYRNSKEKGVCSRNLDVTDKDDNFTRIEKKYGILEALDAIGYNIAIQGELIGEGIQKNPENIEGQDFYVFDIFSINDRRYLTAFERNIILKELGDVGCNLKTVPVLDDSFKIKDMTLQDILKMAEGTSLFSKNREGLVFKSNELINGRTFSFKAISNKYLMSVDD